MNKNIALCTAFFCLSVSLASCSATTGGQSAGMPVPGSAVKEKEVFDESGVTPRVIPISVGNWSFSPNAITAEKGEEVKVRLTGVGGMHGFTVPALGVNTSVSEGKTVDIILPTGKTGIFTFFCSIPCGDGHRDMTGTITVAE